MSGHFSDLQHLHPAHQAALRMHVGGQPVSLHQGHLARTLPEGATMALISRFPLCLLSPCMMLLWCV
jgi:hypothetical protein